MIVRELSIDGFRNLHPAVWTPSEGVNILYGDNAQGKTNLLEACWLFTGARSFRGAKDSEMVGFGKEGARLGLTFTAGGREQEASITIRQRRQVTLNGIHLPSANKLAGVFCGVVFSPAHLSLIKDGPEGRRRFVDAAYCQLKPGYIATLTDYHKTLAQRNALLRQARDSGSMNGVEEMLDLWDNTLAVAGARITRAREHYIRRLEPLAAAVYGGLSGERETLTLRWDSPAAVEGGTPADVAHKWLELLRQSRRADMAAGFTTVGAHREDMSLEIDG